MNLTHLHLMVNHVPILGSYVLFFIFGYFVLRRMDQSLRACFWLYAAIAAATIVVYVTGDPAAEVIKAYPGMSVPLIDAHEDSAFIALLLILLLGVASLGALKLFKKEMEIPIWFKYSFLIIGFLSVISISRAASIGGEIRHPEIENSALPDGSK